MSKPDFTDNFYDAILTLKTREECRKFFSDACTPKEINAIAQRFEVAKMLNEKKVYNEIVEATGASPVRLTRASKPLSRGLNNVPIQ